MLDKTAPNDNTEKRHYYLSARCLCLSPHNIILSARCPFLSKHYQLISALCPCLSPHTLVLSTHYSRLSSHYQLISAHLPCLSPHKPVLSARYSSLSLHNLVLSTRYQLIPAHWLCLSPHNPALSARYSCHSSHYPLLSTHYLFIPAHSPLPFLTQPSPFRAFYPSFHRHHRRSTLNPAASPSIPQRKSGILTLCIKIPQTVHKENDKLVPQTLPLSFYVVSPFQIIPSYSGVFPKGLASNLSIGFSENFPLFPFMPLPLQDFSLFFAQKFLLQSLDDLGMFLLEPLAPFRKRIYITCKSQEDYRAYEIEKIIVDHNILILKDLP